MYMSILTYQFVFAEAAVSTQFKCHATRTGTMLCTYKAVTTSNVVCGQQSNHYPCDTTKHGSGSMWLHVSDKAFIKLTVPEQYFACTC